MQSRLPTTFIVCSQCLTKQLKWPYEIKNIKDKSKYICNECRAKKSIVQTCQECSKEFKSLIKENRKFCSKRCSAIYNNRPRIGVAKSPEVCESISQGMKRYIAATPHRKRRESIQQKRCKIHYKTCTGCNNIFIAANAKKNLDRKTCCEKCSIEASVRTRTYQNGLRKSTRYFNQFQNKEVLLDSSWEVTVAKALDSARIQWLRPTPLKWYDSANKMHLYYPDFYLPEIDVYLDPKNPYCMDQDREKMEFFKRRIVLIFGNIEHITNFINKIM